MATHFSILAWKILLTEEPGGLPFMGSQRVGHDWVTNTSLHFTITTLNSFSGRLPVYFSFIWSCGFLPCFIVCWILLCHVILSILLCLCSPFFRQLGHSSSRFCFLVGEVGPVGFVGFILAGMCAFVVMREDKFFPLMGRALWGSVFWVFCSSLSDDDCL